MTNEIDHLKQRFLSKIDFGQKLLTSLKSLKNVAGVSKLQKKIRQEIVFLNKVLNSDLMKNEHLLSTNLHHFDALVCCTFESADVISVLETKSYKNKSGQPKKLCVDIICENGRKWIKVIARNPKALSQILSGDGEYGQKSIVDHAIEYVACAKQNHYMFKQPEVYFYFASGVTTSLTESLKEVNVNVIGCDVDTYLDDEVKTKFNDDSRFCHSKVPSSDSSHHVLTCNEPHDYLSKLNISDLDLINLDVSSMLAYVSALTNGGSNRTFKEPLLNQQGEWERKQPVKPILENLFKGKKLICCKSAIESFKEIVDIIGGPSEKERALKLMSVMEIMPDTPYTKLRLGGRIKQRSLVIFGTGYHLKALTVTANEGFIRAAKHQGANFAVFIHESRALTEIKQDGYL